jgi:hypothetical protein
VDTAVEDAAVEDAVPVVVPEDPPPEDAAPEDASVEDAVPVIVPEDPPPEWVSSFPFPASWMNSSLQAIQAYGDETYSAVDCLGKSMTGECTHTRVGDIFVEVVVEDAKNIVDKKLETT